MYAYLQLLDVERIDELITRVARMDAAYLTNFALADPERLGAARDRLELELATAPGEPLIFGVDAFDPATLVEAARALFEQHRHKVPLVS